QVTNDELTRAPAQSLEQAMQGKVPGATISMNSGAPGGGAQMQIRGVTSILGNGQPLFVMDGVIISNDAISDGANSVTGAGSRASRSGRSAAYRLLGTRQFETVDKVLSLPYGNGGARTDTVLMNALYPSGQIPFTRDYEDEFYSNSNPSYEVTGSFSGGTAATQYYVNLTSRDEVGTAPRTGARLYALRTNVDQSFLEGKIKVNVGLNVTRNSLNRGLSNNDNTCTSPIYCFAYTPGVINLDSLDATGTYVRNPFNGGGNTESNPFETFQYLRLNELTFRQIGNLNATWSALSAAQHQLSVSATGGFDRVQISGDLF